MWGKQALKRVIKTVAFYQLCWKSRSLQIATERLRKIFTSLAANKVNNVDGFVPPYIMTIRYAPVNTGLWISKGCSRNSGVICNKKGNGFLPTKIIMIG